MQVSRVDRLVLARPAVRLRVALQTSPRGSPTAWSWPRPPTAVEAFVAAASFGKTITEISSSSPSSVDLACGEPGIHAEPLGDRLDRSVPEQHTERRWALEGQRAQRAALGVGLVEEGRDQHPVRQAAALEGGRGRVGGRVLRDVLRGGRVQRVAAGARPGAAPRWSVPARCRSESSRRRRLRSTGRSATRSVTRSVGDALGVVIADRRWSAPTTTRSPALPVSTVALPATCCPQAVAARATTAAAAVNARQFLMRSPLESAGSAPGGAAASSSRHSRRPDASRVFMFLFASTPRGAVEPADSHPDGTGRHGGFSPVRTTARLSSFHPPLDRSDSSKIPRGDSTDRSGRGGPGSPVRRPAGSRRRSGSARPAERWASPRSGCGRPAAAPARRPRVGPPPPR